MLLSVIVPVYNVEEYLPTCIESILNQTFKDFEVILVDDGSTDESGQICDEYAKKDERVKVIHKENGGLSDARNVGLLSSKGKYIAFVDGDDFIIETAFEKLMRKITIYDAEIVVGNEVRYISDSKKIKPKKRHLSTELVYTGIEFMKLCMEQGAMYLGVPYNIYKRSLIIDNNLFFKKGILHEDLLWTPLVFLKANKVVYEDIDFYMHRIRQGSITQSVDKTKNGIDIINSCYELSEEFDKIDDVMARMVLNDFLVTMYLSGFFIGKLYKRQHRQILNAEFLKNRAFTPKNKVKVAIFCFNKKLYYLINFLVKKTLSVVR